MNTDMKIFLWFAANHETRLIIKIYAVASDMGEARRLLEQLPLSTEMKALIASDKDCQIFDSPWAEVNVSQNGRAMSYCRDIRNDTFRIPINRNKPIKP